MLKEACEEIKEIDDCLSIDMVSTGGSCSVDKVFNNYCPIKGEGEMRQCDTNNEKITAVFLWFLVTFEHLCDASNFVNEMGQYAEYAILWLGYKLNQISNDGATTLKDFYREHIKNNTDDIDYKNHLDNKIDSMNIDIKDISNIYEAFGILCKIYAVYNENDKECTNCSKNAEEFVQKIGELNKDPNINGNDSYSKILSTLSNGYNYLKNHYANNCTGCSNISNFPDINPQKNSLQNSLDKSGQDHAQDNIDGSVDSSLQGHTDNSLHVSEFASSSSSVASKLIPVLSIFAIPLFFGIAYKYSLFGFGKRVHRKHLREKVKK
ncbi:Plasmodium variant antigen protein Cir/Yir/Bir, putative [Plasmodium chabaudi adami]|uniref:Plasmodium variant antigen protein Cir/Yir/Bir, putative n=1 Tax=Plasmodium chabaudi adami TaxID=5826 RepID=A0A1D3LAF6_PLACE|nr:Plasmodium variant antigen protein Cir/Yir/Bir, putative [Plasmodium chabaudi adami]